MTRDRCYWSPYTGMKIRFREDIKGSVFRGDFFISIREDVNSRIVPSGKEGKKQEHEKSWIYTKNDGQEIQER